MNAIEGILSFLEGQTKIAGDVRMLGLAFLNGCSDGDGGVLKSSQPKSAKYRTELYLTEGRRSYAVRLVKVFRAILGVGSMYKPRGRNYYLVSASLNPIRAAALLSSGFFSEHPVNRRRLALKALDSAYMSRYVHLFSKFGPAVFSREDLSESSFGIGPDFIGRSVLTGALKCVGVVVTQGKPYHWCRSYKLSRDVQIAAQEILGAIGGTSALAQTK